MGMKNTDTHQYIFIKGAKVHNLKNIDVVIPKNQFVVVTGMSGSGKSSLAFDTLYAEGQRRYVESLSAYARQFLGKMNKPEVDDIKGIVPAVAIEQKVISSNPRSTVGTSTEIYDYLKLLFARIGQTFSPISHEIVKKDSVSSVVDFIENQKFTEPINILAPLISRNERSLKEELAVLLQKGFVRIFYQQKIQKIESLIEDTSVKNLSFNKIKDIYILIDRLTFDDSDETKHRLADSIQMAFFEGNGDCVLLHQEEMFPFCDRFELDGLKFEVPTPNFFSFNNPYGACKNCEGYGMVIGIDPDLVIPDKSKSVYDGALAPWRGEKMKEFLDIFVKNAHKFDFPVHRSISDLTEQEYELLWTGNSYFQGLNAFFLLLEEQTFKIQNRVLLSRYRGKTVCPECKGSRLRKDAHFVKIGGKSITDLVLMPIVELIGFFENLSLSVHDAQVSKRLLLEINSRIHYLNEVGLGYLTLNRLSNTLSGGESQRIHLATSLGSSLVGSMYVLDEPSIGLHPRDTQRLIQILRNLKNAGNTVLVVEHEEEMMQAADYLIDIGPEAGTNGGNLIFSGVYADLLKSEQSLTGKYLSGQLRIEIPEKRRKFYESISLTGVRENNLKNVSVKFPLGVLTAVTGVSGSGKTSLVKRVLYPALQKTLGSYSAEHTGIYDQIEVPDGCIHQVELIDQNPIGRSSRSNPVTYVKAWDDIRNLFVAQPLAKAAGLKASSFSFNVEGGRCDACQGEGEVKIEMQFMADIYLPCESCNGQRFKQNVLDVTYSQKNVAEVLAMTIDEALTFFKAERKITAKLQALVDVGLGYVQLGQSSNTLSGGEAQRIKLASFLIKGNTKEKTLFIFDEPTTGLHFHDIHKLLKSFYALIHQGHSILVIEHNMDIIKCADWVIDIGPEGGKYGGEVVFEGTPEALAECERSHTATYLKKHLK